MNCAKPVTLLDWQIVETGDRWYQAVLRFTLGTRAPLRGELRRCSRAEVSRWADGPVSNPQRAVVLLWEIPEPVDALIETLETIVQVRQARVHAIQLAYLPRRRRAAWSLAAQEAGVSVLVDDLAALQRVIQSLAGILAKPELRFPMNRIDPSSF